ncbi:MAG: hypothetical protein BWY31_02433 [Lentisphaerae bacterium ADurb.Bin242]|nr:MAG: hypothetical protein BWY31_02433 [Lentisphaerae bacterium ADurb.Bin242]
MGTGKSIIGIFLDPASVPVEHLIVSAAVALLIFSMVFIPMLRMFDRMRPPAAIGALCVTALALGGITENYIAFIVAHYAKAAVTMLLLLIAGIVLYWKVRSKWPFN